MFPEPWHECHLMPSPWCRGNGASVLRIVPYAALNFTAYERYRSALITAWGLSEQPLHRPSTSSQTSSHHDDPHAHHVSAQPATYQRIPPIIDLLAGEDWVRTGVVVSALRPCAYPAQRL